MKNPAQAFCRGCGERMPRGLSKFCPDCAPIHRRLRLYMTAEGQKSFWAYVRKHGKECCLSGVKLELNDPTGPWYLVFSRLIPGNKNSLAPAAALFNDMKSALTRRAFRRFVIDLHNHRQKHLKVKKRPIPHWRLLRCFKEGACPVCGRPALKGHKFCARCSRIVYRMKHLRLSAEAIKGVLDYLHKYGFVDYYTGMPLVLDDPKSPWYLVFDHWIPRDSRKIVVTSALVNFMKGDLTEKEFWYFIRQLANFYRHGTPVRKIKLRFWSRPYR